MSQTAEISECFIYNPGEELWQFKYAEDARTEPNSEP